jgi:hypothetical protein
MGRFTAAPDMAEAITASAILHNGVVEIEKQKPRIITLCGRCASEYRDAGVKVERDQSNTTKSACDHCRVHSGFDYFISDPKTKNIHSRRE